MMHALSLTIQLLKTITKKLDENTFNEKDLQGLKMHIPQFEIIEGSIKDFLHTIN
jgi:hypothetical protein